MSLDDAAPLRPPPRAGFNMKAAMIVPGIGLLILVVFIGAGFLTSNPVQQTKTSTGSFSVPGHAAAGRAGRARPQGHHGLGPAPGQHPQRRLDPPGRHRVSFANNTQSAQQYDAQITLKADDSQAALETFFKKDMKKQGWQIFEHRAG